MNNVDVYKEGIYHFSCPPCKAKSTEERPMGYWSVSDAPVDIKKKWFCTWCGKPITIKEIQEIQD